MNTQAATDDSNITELEISPDGRIYVFGASPEILNILNQLDCRADSVRERLDHVAVDRPVAAILNKNLD